MRRGTDIVKAVALGARAVLLGRPALWGLAVNGEQGVVDVIAMLRDEFDLWLPECCRDHARPDCLTRLPAVTDL